MLNFWKKTPLKFKFRVICRYAILAGVMGFSATQTFALNIVVCNDDSIAAAHVRAMKQKLVEAGHKPRSVTRLTVYDPEITDYPLFNLPHRVSPNIFRIFLKAS